MNNEKLINSPFHGMKIAVISLGCAKNRIDTEEVLGKLTRGGALLTDKYDEADIIYINTCGFIESAQQEAVDTLLEMASFKKTGKGKLVVSGCLVEVYGEELLKSIPELDGAIGAHSYHELEDFFRDLLEEKRPFRHSKAPAAYTSLGERILTRPGHSVDIRIAEGCSNCCKYCLIPGIRGPYRSRQPESIVDEIRKLAGQGSKEFVLIAQDTTAYGSDLKTGVNLSGLLKMILTLQGDFWLRIMYTYPSRIDGELIDLIASENRICSYLDIPIQHADSAVLELMGRHYRSEGLEKLFSDLRSAVPDIAIRTTCMVGYPGETRGRFEFLKKFMLQHPFEHMGSFIFSAQEGTKAAALAQSVPIRVASRRRRELMETQQQLAFERKLALLGRIMKILVDGPVHGRPGWYLGRTEYQAPEVDGYVYIYSADALVPGDWVRGRIDLASPYSLLSRRVCK